MNCIQKNIDNNFPLLILFTVRFFEGLDEKRNDITDGIFSQRKMDYLYCIRLIDLGMPRTR